jgi:hypothetical protein
MHDGSRPRVPLGRLPDHGCPARPCRRLSWGDDVLALAPAVLAPPRRRVLDAQQARSAIVMNHAPPTGGQASDCWRRRRAHRGGSRGGAGSPDRRPPWAQTWVGQAGTDNPQQFQRNAETIRLSPEKMKRRARWGPATPMPPERPAIAAGRWRGEAPPRAEKQAIARKDV